MSYWLCRNFVYIITVIMLTVISSSYVSFAFNEPIAINSKKINGDFLVDYHIGGNDVLEISVYGENDLTQEVRVTNSGYITYPLLGRISVATMTVVELEDYLRNALAKDYIRNPQVRVFVREFSNVYVLGQVTNPASYLFKGGMTVVQAITLAGGFTNVASKGKVRVVRTHGGDRNVIGVNVNRVTKGEDEDILLQPGDTVVVPESFF